MALSIGTRLGPYEVASAIGAGGMGEVYRARDTRLDRTVAIKVLTSRLSASPELKLRFEREARTISSLQHPHICTLFDIGSQDGLDYLVMEYLVGETLADRLRKGPLPWEQVAQIGVELADALGAAHRQGIVHRDLKPGNVMLAKSGAKLMDFGLAKPIAPIAASVTSAAPATPSSPTMSLAELTNPASPLTAKGTVMGTSQYMAPEVLRGQEADARSDIFSFGCVLYEMATGRRAFEGKSQLSVLTAILEKDPEPISSVRAMTPPLLDRIVMQCLAKDPEQRWQNAVDIAAGLGWVFDLPPAVAAPESNRRSALVPAVIALCVVAGLAAGGTWWTLRSRTKPFTGPVLTRLTSDAGLSTGPALSRDARYCMRCLPASARSAANPLPWYCGQSYKMTHLGLRPPRLSNAS